MAEIVNLRRVKKAKARAEKEAGASANRAKHGVAKSERDLAEALQNATRRTNWPRTGWLIPKTNGPARFGWLPRGRNSTVAVNSRRTVTVWISRPRWKNELQ